MNRQVLVVFICLAGVLNFTSADTIRGINIDFVAIGNAGNAGDTVVSNEGTAGHGSVAYNYRIGKYEVTNSQWNAFLTAAGAPAGNPSSAYDSSASTGTQQPTNNLSWYEAAQFCNYLTSGDKSKGAYLFSGNNSNAGDFLGIDRAAALTVYRTIYVIPTEDEWYKAAYFKPDGSGYSLYANGTNTAPIVGVQSNYNYTVGAPWDVNNGIVEQNGTLNMMGNVWEWNENNIIRGASFTDVGTLASSYRRGNYPNGERDDIGFRVAFISSDSNPEVVIINSGVDAATFINAPLGGGGFDHVFTSADFLAARNGAIAHIVPSENTGSPWIPHHRTSLSALWINCSATNWPSASTLYAFPFTLTETNNVKLEFFYAIDNLLGDSLNSGLFVNGHAVSGVNNSNLLECSSVHRLILDITDYVVYGQNYLYVYQYDNGGWSGSQFTAIISANTKDIGWTDNIRGIAIDFIPIGNAGNIADTKVMNDGTTGYGAVSYNYSISKYEITNGQWNAFTSIAGLPNGNPISAYDTNAVHTGELQPTNRVSWHEALQFCNYLTSGDKSKGVYRFSGDNFNPGDCLGIDRETAKKTYGTIYCVPTEDEWYKAAYLKPDGSGYSLYANGTDIVPVAGIEANHEWFMGEPWIVGIATQEQNGTFDMMGNVWEWIELEYGAYRVLRGGSYYGYGYSGAWLAASSRHAVLADAAYNEVGFRIVCIPASSTSPAITVTVGIHPNTLNLQSQGNWITCIISFPPDVYAADVNSNSIWLNGQIRAEWTQVDENKNIVLTKFSRTALEGILQEGTVELTVSGTLNNGKQFEGKDTITVIKKPYCLSSPSMDFNGDCKVDIKDYAIFVQSWLECNLEPKEACGQ